MKLNCFEMFIKPLKGVKEQYKSDYIERTEETFGNSTSYKEIWKNYDYTAKHDVRIVESSNAYRKDIAGKKLIMPPGGDINKGDYVHIEQQSNTWLVTGYDDLYQERKTAFIQLCGESPLKWYDNNTKLQVWDCIIGIPNSRGGGFVTDRYLMTSLSYLPVVIQKNPHTRKIRKNQRFIFGSSVYKVTFIDDFSGDKNSNIIKLELTATEEMLGDDFDSGIAFNPWNDDVYKIQVSNKNIQDSVGETREIVARVYYADNLVDEDLTYSSADENIATVSQEGVIYFNAVGSTEIKVSLSNNSDVFTYVDVVVSDSIVDSKYISLFANNGTNVDNQNMKIDTMLQVNPVLTVSSWVNGDTVSDSYTVEVVDGADIFGATLSDGRIMLKLYRVGSGKIIITDSDLNTYEYDVTVRTLF